MNRCARADALRRHREPTARPSVHVANTEPRSAGPQHWAGRWGAGQRACDPPLSVGAEPSSQANPTRVSHWAATWLEAGFAKIVWKPCVEQIGGRYAPGGGWCRPARTL